VTPNKKNEFFSESIWSEILAGRAVSWK